MEAKELRIGNIININGTDITPGIGYGVIMDFTQKDKGIKNEYLDTLEFNPIPLTEEWLLKFAFEKHGNDDEYRFYKDDYYIEDMTLKTDEVSLTNLRHVHQLQNLYFALTGEELTISKKVDQTETHLKDAMEYRNLKINIATQIIKESITEVKGKIMTEVNYKDLLSRYLKHIESVEGSFYIDNWDAEQNLSEQDINELRKLSDN